MASKGRILLVEDMPEWQLELTDLLEGYDVVPSTDLHRAIFLLMHEVYDLVLLDLRLKEWEEDNFEGWKLMDRLQTCRREQGTQVIIISAYGEQEHVRQGFKQYKIFDYIDKKHFDEDEFRNAVAGSIERALKERGEIAIDQ